MSSTEGNPNNYPVFEPNQLLTSTHLNQLRIYLDAQDKLTRTRLIGIGIVCGFDLNYQSGKIQISKGTGITSEGYLIHAGAKVFDRATKTVYVDPKGYKLFRVKEDEPDQIPMWELKEKDESYAGDTLPLTQAGIKIRSKVVVAFQEFKDIDLESCVGQNCDDKGKERRFKVRYLLIDCDNVDKIIRKGYKLPYFNQDTGDDSLDGSLNLKYRQTYAVMPNFTFVPYEVDPVDYPDAYRKINSAEDINKRYSAIYTKGEINPTAVLAGQIKNAYRRFLPLLSRVSETDKEFYEKLSKLFEEQFAASTDKGILQYYYDYTKDIVKAYNEFLDLVFEVEGECCPSAQKFPRHLVLGKVVAGLGCPETEDNCKPKLYRTHFIQSPIYNEQKDKLAEAEMAFERIVQMIKAYTVFCEKYEEDIQLKLTPSDEKMHSLCKASIPYYYPSDSLYRYWNYELSKKCKAPWNLGYHMDEIKAAIKYASKPLYFNQDGKAFYRIEGLMGKKYKEVVFMLEAFKRKFQLEFDVEPLKLQRDGNVLPKANCGLIDIKEDYLQLRAEIIAETDKYSWLLSKFFYFVTNPSQVMANVTKGTTNKAADKSDPSLVGLFKASKQVDALIAELPLCIDDFNHARFREEFLKVQRMAFLITVIFERWIRALYGAANMMGILMAPVIQNAIERYFLVNHGFIGSIYDLNEVLRSDIDVKMASLYRSYKIRLAKIEEGRLFSNFAFRNPGLQHMAGVPKGGTFILAYENEKESNVVADFALNGKPCCKERFDFCSDDVSKLGPVAKSVYFFLDSKVPREKVYIDVLEFAIDLDPAKKDEAGEIIPLDLEPFSAEAKSEQGRNIRRVDSPSLGRAVVEYEPYNDDDKGEVDTFEFEISNAHGKKDTGMVFISRVPDGINLMTSIAQALDAYQAAIGGSSGEEEEEVDETGGVLYTGEDFEYDSGIGMASIYEHGLDLENNRATLYIAETKKKYWKIKDLGPLPDDAPIEDRKKYETDLVKEYKHLMEETKNEIKNIDISIGEEPEDPNDALMYRINNEKKFAERAALIALYDGQMESFVNKVKTEGLATSETDSPAYDFVKTDLTAFSKDLSNHTGRTAEVFNTFSTNEDLNPVTRDLFKSVNLNF